MGARTKVLKIPFTKQLRKIKDILSYLQGDANVDICMLGTNSTVLEDFQSHFESSQKQCKGQL